MIYLKKNGKSQFVSACLLALPFLTASAAYADQSTDSSSTSPEFFGFKPPIDFNWAGPYVGGYLGGALAKANVKTTAGSITNDTYFSDQNDITAVGQSGTNTISPNASLAGIQVGDNFFTSPRITLGWVMDYSSFHLSETNTANNTPYPSGAGNYSLQTSVTTNWLSTVRGRFGLTPPTSWPMMFYATGGLALANVKVSNSFSDTSSLAGTGESSTSSNQLGWTAGAGFELPLAQHLTLNAEYLYVNLGSVDTTSSLENSAGGFGISPNSLASPLTTSVDLHANLFKLGLNYKF